MTNTGQEPRTVSPRLVVDTTLGFRRNARRTVVNGHEAVFLLAEDDRAGGGSGAAGTVVQLGKLRRRIEPGKTAAFFALHCADNAAVAEPRTRLRRPRRPASRRWPTGRAPLCPTGRIEVPDAGIRLVDSSIRNIWQAREIKNGMPAFQVGPTCYRGLWIVDGAFLLEAATMLGAGDQARNGVAYELTHQKPDGRIEVMRIIGRKTASCSGPASGTRG